MSDPASAASAVASSLSILDSIISLIRASRSSGSRLALPEMLATLPGEAARLVDSIVNRLEGFKQSLLNANVDLKQSLNQIQEDIGFFRKRLYRIPANLSAEMNGIALALTNLVNDYVALANCREAEDELVTSFKESRPLRDQIKAVVDPNRPLWEVLDDLLKHAHDLQDQLRDLSR